MLCEGVGQRLTNRHFVIPSESGNPVPHAVPDSRLHGHDSISALSQSTVLCRLRRMKKCSAAAIRVICHRQKGSCEQAMPARLRFVLAECALANEAQPMASCAGSRASPPQNLQYGKRLELPRKLNAKFGPSL
jgi:hypothetical protein